jgi:anti-sigma regulatory factor (Ser/Thr protein kinase)
VTQPARRRFPGRRDQVACARAFIRDVIGCCPLLDEAILLTSELCTNALQHSGSGNGGTFEVTIYHAPGSVRIEVSDDGSASTPAPKTVDDCSEDGRGLEIVARIAHRWGQRGDEYGRCVYFELRWNPPAAATSTPAPPSPSLGTTWIPPEALRTAHPRRRSR